MDVSDITIYFFLASSLSILIKILLRGDYEDKRLQKIFGGIIVLIAALVSKDPWVIGFSLFIGGLIVASEDFMKFLAAVVKTRSDKVAETVAALITSASEEERKSSVENEVLETRAAEKIAEETISQRKSIKGTKPKLSLKHSHLTYSTLLPKLEMGTLRYVFKYMNGFGRLEENVRFGSYVFDGFATSGSGRPYFLEVKVFPNITRSDGKILVSQVTTRLKFWLPRIISAFDSLPVTNDQKRPVLIVNLVLNVPGDLSPVKEEVKKLNLHRLSDHVLVKFQYLNLPDLVTKGAFTSSIKKEDLLSLKSAKD